MCRCDYRIERSLLNRSYRYICGVDEVGRGAVFGPVVAGAVILDPEKEKRYRGIDDSKKLKPGKRMELARYIYKNAVAFSMGWCWNDVIDETNILKATKSAMRMAVDRLQVRPDYVLVDGMRSADFMDIPGQGIVKGDEKSVSIAAASIIAKVFRDDLVSSFSHFFPVYRFENHKGYGTRLHREAVNAHGLTTFHRRSFNFGDPVEKSGSRS